MCISGHLDMTYITSGVVHFQCYLPDIVYFFRIRHIIQMLASYVPTVEEFGLYLNGPWYPKTMTSVRHINKDFQE